MASIVVTEPVHLARGSRLAALRSRAWVGWAVVLGLVGLAAVLGSALAPYSATEQAPTDKFLGLWAHGARGLHVLGTDELGRDVLSKVIVGARLTMFIALTSTAIGAIVGVTLGLLAGYHGGRVDRVVSRLAEAQTAMPMFLIALLLLSVAGASVWNLIIVLPTYVWPTFARIVRAETLRMRNTPFIEAAHALGCRTRTILWRHLFPNLMSRVGVLAAISAGQVILAEAGLSFLGAGVQPPDVTWGLLIASGRKYLAVAWWPTVFPGLAAGLTVFALNGLARRFTSEAGAGR